MVVTTASGATWQEVARDRQDHRDATIAAIVPSLPDISEIPLNTIPVARQVLTAEEIKITETTVEVLAAQLAKGELSAVEVTNAFLRRAGLAQKVVNCITELLPDRALTRAKELDEYLKTHGKPMGPLHGIPISVKEHLSMKGLDINAGFISWVGRIAEEDSHILQILWSAGCVFFARTTQPQSLMHLETNNNLYGVTTNPYNTTLTAGGSSGGEGALIGFRGSCLGIGTDIGGSIRSPAANNGLYGFKPTTLRLPVGGWSATMAGAEGIIPTIGPLSTSLAGCKLFMKTIIAAQPWLTEPALLPFPWKEEGEAFKGKKLKVAVLWDDGVVKPHPPITRAMEKLASALKAGGNVDVVDWKPYKHELAWDIIANLYFCDGGAQESSAIDASGEPWLPLTTHILSPTANKHVQEHTISSLWTSTVQRDAYRTEYAKYWTEQYGDVDVVLCPVGPGVAPKIETAKYWGYTSQWNLLDYPALVFPVDQVDAEGAEKKEDAAEKYVPRNQKDEYNWALWEQFGCEGYKDAPVSLQIVGRRYEDEKVVKACEVIMQETGCPFAKYV